MSFLIDNGSGRTASAGVQKQSLASLNSRREPPIQKSYAVDSRVIGASKSGN